MMKNRFNGYVYLAFLAALTACNVNEEPEDLFPLNAGSVDFPEFEGMSFNADEVHPNQRNIPHSDAVPVSLTPAALTEADDIPKPLELLHRFLNDSEPTFEISDLDFFTSGNIWFHAESLNDSTLILSDDRSNELHHFHLNQGDSEKFARQGRGPGDLLFNREVQLVDETLYVAMEGFRIALFDCSSVPCEHVQDIQTKYNHYSAAPNNEKLVVLGIPPYMGPDSGHETPRYTLHEIDPYGETVTSFSPVYDHSSPIVHIQFTMGNRVRYFESRDIYLMTNNNLPFIYMYNSDYELENKYLIPNFSPGYYLFDSSREAGTSYRHNSNIYHIRKVDSNWLLVQIRHIRNAVPRDGYEESYSYYAFHVGEEMLYRIGEDYAESVEESRAIFLTDHGVLINQQGSLQWIEI